MKRMARQFTEQFKKDALSYVHNHSDLSINACARNLGISTNILHGWVKKTKERGEVHRGSGNNESNEAKENARLRKELRDTKDALEILKKAISILGD
jgi:transposase